jgi:mannitol-specific phosphotransferase system IIBC component
MACIGRVKGAEMEGILALLVPIVALSIPITAIVLSHRQKTQKSSIQELELQKEILKLEIEKQSSTIKLLEEENKKMDKIIYHEK